MIEYYTKASGIYYSSCKKFFDNRFNSSKRIKYTRKNRNDLPTGIGYHENGTISFKRWCKTREFYQELHRENAPALIEYDQNGNVIGEKWYIYGILNLRSSAAREIECVGEVCPISREVFEENDRVIPKNY